MRSNENHQYLENVDFLETPRKIFSSLLKVGIGRGGRDKIVDTSALQTTFSAEQAQSHFSMKYIRVLLLLLTPPALAEENKDIGDLLNEIAPEPGERQRSLAGFTCCYLHYILVLSEP